MSPMGNGNGAQAEGAPTSLPCPEFALFLAAPSDRRGTLNPTKTLHIWSFSFSVTLDPKFWIPGLCSPCARL